jgi:hypothetical protein
MVYMKDPDGVWESVRESVERDVAGVAGLSDAERDVLLESRSEEAFKAISPWMEHGECLTVVFDTDASTAMVERRG